jgi:hypothetical protein
MQHYQARAAAKSLLYAAHQIGHLAMGNDEAAERYGKAAKAWADVAVKVTEHVKRSPYMQAIYDRLMPIDDDFGLPT